MFFKTTHWFISWWINKTLIISRRTVRMWKKYRRRKYNVTLGRVRAAIVVVEKQWVLHSLSVYICRLWYPTRNAHAPYCHLWPTSLYNIFPHFLIKGTIFEKKKKFAVHKICVLNFSTTSAWNISHSRQKWTIYDN